MQTTYRIRRQITIEQGIELPTKHNSAGKKIHNVLERQANVKSHMSISFTEVGTLNNNMFCLTKYLKFLAFYLLFYYYYQKQQTFDYLNINYDEF